MAISSRDDFTDEVQDHRGNWFASEKDYYDAEASEGDRLYDAMKDEGLLDNVYTNKIQ